MPGRMTTRARASLRRFGERCAGPATIVAAVAIVAGFPVALLALEREPPSPPLGPARAVTDGDTQGLRLREVSDLPARISPEPRAVRRKHERRRARRPATVRARATLAPVATASPAPSATATPAPSATATPAPSATPPAQTAPAPAPARPKPRPRPSGETFDLSG
jgi:hypothetical protein